MKFQNPYLFSKKMEQTHKRTDKPKAICPTQFLKSWGHNNNYFRRIGAFGTPRPICGIGLVSRLQCGAKFICIKNKRLCHAIMFTFSKQSFIESLDFCNRS